MTVLLVVLVVVALVLGVRVVLDWRHFPRIRMIEWDKRQKYIRLYPNPGFTIGSKHWCKAKGRRGH